MRLRDLPGMRPAAIFLIALSLSIGWGIRGNFGHESGAMIAGVLASVAACLLSGREDWRRRVAFFAFFGGLGWGFGGSISYMYPISFAGSEQLRTCIYGFYATFLVGLLWAGLGGMGTALPAVMDRKRLNDFMVPVIFVLGTMVVSNLFIHPWLAEAIAVPEEVYRGGSFYKSSISLAIGFRSWLLIAVVTLLVCAMIRIRCRDRNRPWLAKTLFGAGITVLLGWLIHFWGLNTYTWLEKSSLSGLNMDSTWNRHQNPLYWFDADWFPALAALVGAGLYDLWDRRFSGGRFLLYLGGGGALAGAVVYRIFSFIGINAFLARNLVILVGAPFAINPETRTLFPTFGFLTNWPNFTMYYPQHLGWLLGLMIGIGIYFYFWGTWRHDSKLIVYLAGGWLLAFLIMPVLGSIPLQFMGGFRLTPPRSDDWAGILGVFIAGLVYCLRYKLGGVALAGSITGLMGGFFFTFVPFLRALLRLPGHPLLTPGGASDAWRHYQSANWHSIMEQLHGFGHGIALAVALGVLALTARPQDTPQDRKRWTEFFAVVFSLFFITLMNVFKNVRDWTEQGAKVVPESMKMPLVDALEFSASAWFLITWVILAAPIVALMLLHLRRPLSIVPPSWEGRGQILYLAFLWIMVIANFERALVSFHENRLVTEWVIILNAALATFLVVALPKKPVDFEVTELETYGPPVRQLWRRALPFALCGLLLMAALSRMAYRDQPFESPQVNHKRWGEEAQWRIRPILKHGQHR